ncbi:MAG: 2-hydroxyacyl-CoA dehydratase subunit D [Promethearchaeota archaeon]
MFNPDWNTAWTTVFIPFEILNAMNVSGMFIEFIGAMLSGIGLSREYLEVAEAASFSTDSCAYHRTIIGTTIKKILPEPDILIGANFPCNGGVKALKRIGELYKKKLFIINMPFEYSPKSIDYVIDQYNRMIEFIEAQTGRKLNEKQLQQSIKYNNKAREYIIEALELTKNIPSPANSNDLKNFIMYILLNGTKEGVEVAKTYRDEFKCKVDSGIGGLPHEKFRFLWIQNRIQFKNNLLDILEKKFGANIVIDELNHIWWEPMDESDPLRSLALRNASHPLLGPAERRIAVLTQLAREFKVDGAINPVHWGCRQSGGAKVLVKEALREIGVPVINLDLDCVDDRNFSEAQLMTRLEAFIEML